MARKMANVQAVLEECILTSTAEGAEKKKQSSLESDQLADNGIELGKPAAEEQCKPPRPKRRKRSRKKSFKGFKERCKGKNKELTELVKKIEVENEVLNEKNKSLIKKSLILQR